MFKNAFSILQKIGKALMLPVAVLPVAGLLLGLGATDFHGYVSPFILSLMKNAGDVIFGNLPLIFAIGVALGFTENDGVAAVAATIGYLVMTVTLGVMAKTMGITLDTIKRSLASRMRYSARAESGVVLDRRIAEDAREQARFGL